MIMVAALDPASFSLWFDPFWFQKSPATPGDELTLQAIELCLEGNLSALLDLLQTIKDEEIRDRCIHHSSLIWHEQRHFVDLLLTNYGAFRFRQFFQLYVNIFPILVELLADADHSAIFFPFHLYADEKQRRIHQIPAISEAVKTLANEIKNRRRVLDIETGTVPEVGLQVGGESQLEALGYLFQFGAVQHLFNHKSFMKMAHYHDPFDKKYTWFRYFVRPFGAVLTEQAGTTRADFKHVGPILYATLAMRAWGQEPPNDPMGLVINTSLGRLFKYIEYFGKRPNLLAGMNRLTDVWETLNEIALELFGRSITEEIRIDLQQSQAYLTQLSERGIPVFLRNVYAQYHMLRTALVEILESNPEALLDIPNYSRTILPLVRPIPIRMFPGGLDVEQLPKMGLRPLVEYETPQDVLDQIFTVPLRHQWCWFAIPDEWKGKGLSFPNLDDWTNIAQIFAPLAKLFLNGRNHRAAFGPELFLAEKLIKEISNLDVKFFDPIFKSPTDRLMSAKYYYTIKGGDITGCDLCDQKLQKPNGHILSPWIFHASEHGTEYLAKVYGGGGFGSMQANQDWSLWLVCDSCLDSLKAHNLLE